MSEEDYEKMYELCERVKIGRMYDMVAVKALI